MERVVGGREGSGHEPSAPQGSLHVCSLIDTCVVSFRSSVFKELYDQTPARSQRALYSWMAGALRASSSATGEPVAAPPQGHPQNSCHVLEGRASSSVSLRVFTCLSPNLQEEFVWLVE